jgi:hypothetical protein
LEKGKLYFCEELEEDGRDALFSFLVLPAGSKTIGAPLKDVGDPASMSGDRTPVLAPMAVHHFPECTCQ